MVVKRSIPLWGKLVWWLGILASFVLALYMLLPNVTSLFVQRQFEAFGCKHVNVVVDYPGLRRTVNRNSAALLDSSVRSEIDFR